MQPSLTREQVRLIDKIAIEEYGIPGIVLMENAARGVFDAALEFLEHKLMDRLRPRELKFAVICGGGNNGGDGYAVARHLHNYGCGVKIFAVSDPKTLTGDAALNWLITTKMKMECIDVLDAQQLNAAAASWNDADLIVDAVLGTGFKGALKPNTAAVIEAVNTSRAKPGGPVVLAVDVPSGLDCDTGVPSIPTIQADLTVTFVASKKGFENAAAKECLGGVIVAQIGAPPEIMDRVLRM